MRAPSSAGSCHLPEVGTPLAWEAIAVSGPHEIPTLSGHDARYQLRVWGPIELAGKFEWYELTLQPGGVLASNAHEPGTREHLTVLHGSIEIEAAGTTKRLKAADTARYVADEPHAIRNAGDNALLDVPR